MLRIVELKQDTIRTRCTRRTRRKAEILPQLTAILTFAVDIMPSSGSSVRELVRCNADNRAVFFVQFVDLPGECAAEEVVGLWKAGEGPEEGAAVAD